MQNFIFKHQITIGTRTMAVGWTKVLLLWSFFAYSPFLATNLDLLTLINIHFSFYFLKMCVLEMFSKKIFRRSFLETYLNNFFRYFLPTDFIWRSFSKKVVIWKTFLVKSHPRQSSHKNVSEKLSENCADKFLCDLFF